MPIVEKESDHRASMATEIARRDEAIERMAQVLVGAQTILGHLLGAGIYRIDSVQKVATACREALVLARPYRRTLRDKKDGSNGKDSASA